MDTTIYELNCEGCGNEYELSYIEEDDSPIYCPFCGSDVDLEEVEDESEENDFLDDFDFDKDD